MVPLSNEHCSALDVPHPRDLSEAYETSMIVRQSAHWSLRASALEPCLGTLARPQSDVDLDSNVQTGSHRYADKPRAGSRTMSPAAR